MNVENLPFKLEGLTLTASVCDELVLQEPQVPAEGRGATLRQGWGSPVGAGLSGRAGTLLEVIVIFYSSHL